MTRLLLNADIGEWESEEIRASIFPHLDLANVACGGHAGTPEILQSCAALAEKWNVKLGAHPGTPANRGRGEIKLNCNEFRELILQQIETFIAGGLALNHIKLHGSLYHLSESDESCRKTYIDLAQDLQVPIICLAKGKVAKDCSKANHPYLAEAYLDRAYQANGQLVPRSDPDALVHTWSEQELRLQNLATGEAIHTRNHSKLKLQADTICIHADHKNSAELAAKAKQLLEESS